MADNAFIGLRVCVCEAIWSIRRQMLIAQKQNG